MLGMKAGIHCRKGAAGKKGRSCFRASAHQTMSLGLRGSSSPSQQGRSCLGEELSELENTGNTAQAQERWNSKHLYGTGEFRGFWGPLG